MSSSTVFAVGVIADYGKECIFTFMNIRKAIATLALLVAQTIMTLATASGHIDTKVDSILRQVDYAIDHSDEYVAQKEAKIATLRGELAKAKSDDARYELAFSLYDEYRPFVKDSAIAYLDICIAAATGDGDTSRTAICKALKAHICSNTGTYVESLDILNRLDIEGLSTEAQKQYFVSKTHVLEEISYYSPLAKSREEYCRAAEECREALYAVADSMSTVVLMTREHLALDAQDTACSMRYSDLWRAQVTSGTTEYALFALYRYLEFKNRKDTAEMLLWLGESALADIRNGVLDQGSMWELSNQLILMGEVDRAYRYICYTSECANRFGSRQRLSTISPLLTKIAQEYKAEGELSQSRLRVTLFWLMVLVVMLVAIVVYVVVQRNKLKEARDRLAKGNTTLTNVNAQLVEANAELTRLSEQRQALNNQLSEANRVKEEYVGRFMSLCSRYVERLDDLRKKVRNKIRNGQTADLNTLMRSAEFNTDDLEDLYINFDTAFLHLYPDFVAQFNALLMPEGRITEPQPGRLTTQMRIFALIRLGITDSGKISEILHYSVNTIYNYRAQTKKLSACGKEDFEERVKKIGVIS